MYLPNSDWSGDRSYSPILPTVCHSFGSPRRCAVKSAARLIGCRELARCFKAISVQHDGASLVATKGASQIDRPSRTLGRFDRREVARKHLSRRNKRQVRPVYPAGPWFSLIVPEENSLFFKSPARQSFRQTDCV